MGSAISAIASLATTPGASTQAVNQQTAAKDLAQLILDISAGDTKAAQKDLVTLTKDFGSTAASGTSDTSSPLGKLLSALTKDLGSGDIGAAQKDVETFLSKLESVAASKQTHHTVTDTADLSSSGDTTSESTDITTLSDYLATLLQAIQAGGTSSSSGAASGAASTSAA